MLDNVEIAPVEVFLLIEVNPPSDLTAPEKVVLAM
jgi:hypothetical protein